MKCLVTAVSPDGRHIDYPFPNIRNAVSTFKTNPVNVEDAGDYMRAVSMYDTLFCEEGDVDGVVDKMTQAFPGVDVYVYKVDSIAVRAPGERKTKAITKDGVLPT